jgi:glycosyltransferase involved in cell wall biosynthesis
MAALLATQRTGIKCVTRTHGFDLYEFRSTQHYQPYKSWMDKRIDKVFFISKHGYDYYLNTFAECDFKKYSLSYLGIFNNYSLNQKRQIQNRFVLLSCSYIVPVKRIHLIVKSLAEINDCSIHWIHIGDGVERDTIIFLAHDLLHDKKNISYEFKGFMTNDEVMQFYSEHYFDCFISTSESEGLPVSMMEAISFGIPIIATNVGGVSELVNKDTGILLDPNGDILAIKKAIVDFYNFSEDTKMAIRKAARRLWEAKFNAEVNYAGFSDDLLRISQKG